jgi:uncharacterized membrane protein YdjX (TVP38/TMEM64 family)
MPQRRKFRIALIKAMLLVLFVVMALVLVRYTPVGNWFTAETMNGFMAGAGPWAPVLFVLIFAVGATLFVPFTVLSTLGALLFGSYWGLFYVWAGATVGAGVSFFIGRTLGRDFAAHLIGDRLRKYDDSIERSGFTTVLYLRLIYLPYAPLNFGMGLTRVRFRDFLLASGMALFVVTIIWVFVANAMKEAWQTQSWQPMWSWQVWFSVGLFVFSLFLPKIMKHIIEKPAQTETVDWTPEVHGNSPVP